MANVRREINKLINELEDTVGTKCNYCIGCDRWQCKWSCPEHPKSFEIGEPLDKDSIFFKDGLCVYTFRDFNVALEFFFEHFQDIKIVSPNKLKAEFDKKINHLVDMINL